MSGGGSVLKVVFFFFLPGVVLSPKGSDVDDTIVSELSLSLSLTFDKNLLAIDNKRALESPMKIVQLVNKKEDEEFSLQFQFPQFLHYGGGVSFCPSFFVDDVKVVVVIFFPSLFVFFSGRRRRPGVRTLVGKKKTTSLVKVFGKSSSKRVGK